MVGLVPPLSLEKKAKGERERRALPVPGPSTTKKRVVGIRATTCAQYYIVKL